MASQKRRFWLGLFSLSDDPDRRARLWNGYLRGHLPAKTMEPPDTGPGWHVEAPVGGWPQLTTSEQHSIDELAKQYGGHPRFGRDYMDFSGHGIDEELDLSGLHLVFCKFDKVRFGGPVTASETTRVFGDSSFSDCVFEYRPSFDEASFHAPINFTGSVFKRGASFIGTRFAAGASFSGAVFEDYVWFNDSRFRSHYFSGGMVPQILTSFNGAQFLGGTSFREVEFGNRDWVNPRGLVPQRMVDFTGAKFKGPTTFWGTVFVGPPAFFETELHEDTDFEQAEWLGVGGEHPHQPYAVRAWERLELMMSKLEKPLDRHRFFRMKMKARRRIDGRFLGLLNWLFEKTSDYGWSVRRAGTWWLAHWTVGGLVLSMSLTSDARDLAPCRSLAASLATSFANAHAFLGLAGDERYLAPYREYLKENALSSVVEVVGTVEVILGPMLLFLLLLTIRNRFRLA